MAKKYKYVKDLTISGKRYKFRANTLVELGEKIAKKKAEIESGKATSGGNTLVRKWAVECVDVYKTSQKDVTREKYMYRMNNCILKHIGHLKLKDVTPLDCQRCLNLQSGKSKTQVNEIYQTLQFIFSKAVENNMISDNPAKNIIKPKFVKKNRRSITDSERHHLLAVSENNIRFLPFLIMLYCGCRPSEVRELKWQDIKNLDEVNVLHIKGTKTDNADRIVPIPDALFSVLRPSKPSDYVCLDLQGNKLNADSFRRSARALYRAMNISMGCKVFRNALIPPLPLADDFVPYCLRHTYCTDLQKSGVDIRTAQYLMGHSSITLTADIYTHADQSTIKEAAKLLKATSSK